MAPTSGRSMDISDSRIQALLDIASKVDGTLRKRSELSSDLMRDLRSTLLRSYIYTTKSVSIPTASQLDALACSIWNEASKVHNPSNTIAYAHMQALTMKLLSTALIAVDPNRDQRDHYARLLQISIRAAQSLLQVHDTDLALQVLENCSELLGKCQDYGVTADVDKRLTLSYILLRVQHAKAIRNLDLAEHFVRSIDNEELKKHALLCERAAELFQDYANQLTQKDSKTAKTWFLRALAVLDRPHDTTFISQTRELKMETLISFVRALLVEHGSEAQEEALQQMKSLRSIAPTNESRVKLLELDIFLAGQPLRRDLLGEWLLDVTSSPMSDLNFSLVCKAIQKLKTHDPECAKQGLKRTITTILSTAIDDSAIKKLESCLVTYAHLLTQTIGTDHLQVQPQEFSDLCDQVYDTIHDSVSTTATHAIQSLLWKTVNVGDTTASLAWTQLLRHKVFGKCSKGNRGRIDRKAMQMCLEVGDHDGARQIFSEMPIATQDDTVSVYLAYKTALQCNDHGWASQCLTRIASSSGDEPAILYACAIDAQQSKHRHLVIQTLGALVRSRPIEILDPVLLRCLGRLILADVEHDGVMQLTVVSSFVEVLHLFVARTQHGHTASEEYEWWSKTAFNLGLKCFDTSDIGLLETLLESCVTLVNQGLKCGENQQHKKLSIKLLTCHFAIASKLILSVRTAKSDDSIGIELYGKVRQQVRSFLRLDQGVLQDDIAWAVRRARMRRYDLEAIIKLGQWDDLNTSITSCLADDSGDQWEKLADLALVLHKELSKKAVEQVSQHAPDVLELLQQSVNAIWKQGQDVKRVARWLRITFTIAQEINGISQVSFKLLDQAALLANRGHQGLTEPYPDDELQWLASTAFNRGVDRCIAGDRGIAWQLFDAALELAKQMSDGGALHRCLTAKRLEAVQKMETPK